MLLKRGKEIKKKERRLNMVDKVKEQDNVKDLGVIRYYNCYP